ncbi:MAG: Hcp family type VI secretion system effector [Myxococcota bacterium]
MALNAYLKVEGESQGSIDGSSTRAGHENEIEIYGWSHEIISPRDAASGLPTGRRQHKPITLTKPIDKATPLLAGAHVNNETLTSVVLRAYEPNAAGVEEQYYTIELINASIVGIRAEMLNNKYPENQTHETREHVSLVYQRIVWTHETSGASSTDDWEAER